MLALALTSYALWFFSPVFLPHTTVDAQPTLSAAELLLSINTLRKHQRRLVIMKII